MKYVEISLADVKRGDVIHLGAIGGRVRWIGRHDKPYDSFTISFKKGVRWVSAGPCKFDPNYSNREAPKAYAWPRRQTMTEQNVNVAAYFAARAKP